MTGPVTCVTSELSMRKTVTAPLEAGRQLVSRSLTTPSLKRADANEASNHVYEAAGLHIVDFA